MPRLAFALAALWIGTASAANAQTVVTTYVTKVQEERESTRWTLTEWLRIKERMRMMDLWLAMFSDPKKDVFKPELNLTYLSMRGAASLTDGDAAAQASAVNGAAQRAELWLTNLVSGTVGIRTLNVDLGGEFYQRSAGGFLPEAAAVGADVTGTPAETRKLAHTYYTGDLRLFGKSIQDSSLVLKYGQYKSDNSIPNLAAPAAATEREGKVAGAALQVYVLRWLGAEGNYLAYGDALNPQGSADQRGTYYDYAGFVEVSLLRLMVGRYQEEWSFASLGEGTHVVESGITVGAKLSL